MVGGEEYWLKTAEDLGEACRAVDSDPLAVDLLAAGYGFLERMEGRREAVRRESTRGTRSHAGRK